MTVAKKKNKAKTKPKAKSKLGRPPREIDYSTVHKLASIQCTDAEIAATLDFTEEGFRLRKKNDELLLGALKKGREEGKASLRRMQYQLAKKGNATMLIWLGKQVLEQRDRIEQKTESQVNVSTTTELTDEQLAEIIAKGAAK